jgi:hypothetical protein
VSVLDFLDERSVRHVDDLQLSAARRIAATGGQPFSVGAEIERGDPIDEQVAVVGGSDGPDQLPFWMGVPNEDGVVGCDRQDIVLRRAGE